MEGSREGGSRETENDDKSLEVSRSRGSTPLAGRQGEARRGLEGRAAPQKTSRDPRNRRARHDVHRRLDALRRSRFRPCLSLSARRLSLTTRFAASACSAGTCSDANRRTAITNGRSPPAPEETLFRPGHASIQVLRRSTASARCPPFRCVPSIRLSGSVQTHRLPTLDDYKERKSESSLSSDAGDGHAGMLSVPRLRNLNPLRLFHNNSSYTQIPTDSRNGSPFTLEPLKKVRWPSPRRAGEAVRSVRWSPLRILVWALTSLFILLMLVASRHHKFHGPPPDQPAPNDQEPKAFAWESYDGLKSFYHGIRSLTTLDEWTPQNRYNKSLPGDTLTKEQARKLPRHPSFDPVKINPYPDYHSYEYVQRHGKVETCYIDDNDTVTVPDVYAYPGIPQNMTAPVFGDYKELGIKDDVCYERFGRFGPYGYGYNASVGGLGPGLDSENAGADKVFDKMGVVDYTDVNWGESMKKCYAKNKARFEAKDAHRKVNRHAYILRIWTGYNFNYLQLYSLRAMIAELSIKSGGEYDVYFLLHVKDETLPIWADKSVYQKVIEQNMPKEFWNMTVLWSESQLLNYYPPPFAEPFVNPSEQSVHGVYRSAHFALQWFSQQYPDYDFYWNWEMDLRYIGHYYEFNTAIGDWARRQPRKGMWERAEKFWMPALHGDYANFTDMVERETRENGKTPVWGPPAFQHDGLVPPPPETAPPTSYDRDDFQWGVGEEADLITFNPLFDVSKTNWVFRLDATGYNLQMPPPPRRCAIITVSRLSKRLLDLMHEETWRYRHTMFPEMWPASCALQHGLKAVYAPHPVYFDRDWDLEYMDQVFNRPKEEFESVFGWGEHNFIGSSFYYNSGFSGALWRRWLGLRETKHGGTREEEDGSGRMCLRPVLHHPIKHEIGQND